MTAATGGPLTAADPRAVLEYRVPAAALQVGDLVNTAPGDDDWQQVLGVHIGAPDAPDPRIRRLVESLGGRYVVVRLTDLVPVDGGLYFDDGGTAMVTGESEGEDLPVSELASEDYGERIYLFTKFELVTVRAS